MKRKINYRGWGVSCMIYVLVDPRNSRIYYVGRTGRGRNRLSDHISLKRMPTGNARKDLWILDLLMHSMEPLFVVLESVNDQERDTKEKEWIELLAKLGAPLTNKTLGHPSTNTRPAYVVDEFC